jgi:Xaa-Pro aminopeptidase
MDVHDTDDIPRTIPLTPGMVVTVEPGTLVLLLHAHCVASCLAEIT